MALARVDFFFFLAVNLVILLVTLTTAGFHGFLHISYTYLCGYHRQRHLKLENHMLRKKEIPSRLLLGKVCTPQHLTALICKIK